MAERRVMMAVSRPVWGGTAVGWLLPPDRVEMSESDAEAVRAVDRAAVVTDQAHGPRPSRPKGPGRE